MPRNLGTLSCVEIYHGYLACERGRHVRVRRIADSYWLTAKHRRGVGRDEETVALGEAVSAAPCNPSLPDASPCSIQDVQTKIRMPG